MLTGRRREIANLTKYMSVARELDPGTKEQATRDAFDRIALLDVLDGKHVSA